MERADVTEVKSSETPLQKQFLRIKVHMPYFGLYAIFSVSAPLCLRTQCHTVGTFRISFHNFIFGLSICEAITRMISQKKLGELFCEMSCALFTNNVVIWWWPVVEWQFSYKNQRK